MRQLLVPSYTLRTACPLHASASVHHMSAQVHIKSLCIFATRSGIKLSAPQAHHALSVRPNSSSTRLQASS